MPLRVLSPKYGEATGALARLGQPHHCDSSLRTARVGSAEVFMRPYIGLALVLVLGLTIALSQTPATKIVHQDEFFVVGIEAHTSGEKEMSG